IVFVRIVWPGLDAFKTIHCMHADQRATAVLSVAGDVDACFHLLAYDFTYAAPHVSGQLLRIVRPTKREGLHTLDDVFPSDETPRVRCEDPVCTAFQNSSSFRNCDSSQVSEIPPTVEPFFSSSPRCTGYSARSRPLAHAARNVGLIPIRCQESHSSHSQPLT